MKLSHGIFHKLCARNFYSVEKWNINSHQKNISSNQFSSKRYFHEIFATIVWE